MQFIIYPLLNLRSKRAALKQNNKRVYIPRQALFERLAFETGMSHQQIFETLQSEIRQIKGSFN